MVEGVGRPSTEQGRERHLSLRIDRWRPASHTVVERTDGGGAERVQRAEPDAGPWPTRVGRDRTLTALGMGEPHARAEPCTNALASLTVQRSLRKKERGGPSSQSSRQRAPSHRPGSRDGPRSPRSVCRRPPSGRRLEVVFPLSSSGWSHPRAGRSRRARPPVLVCNGLARTPVAPMPPLLPRPPTAPPATGSLDPCPAGP